MHITLILLAVLITLFLAYRFLFFVKGSGTIISENREVKAFNKVSLEGIGKIIYKKGERQSVYILTDDNIMKHIETRTKGGTLWVRCAKHSTIKPSKLEIHVTAPSLDGFSGKGKVAFQSDDAIETKEFSLSLTGKSVADLALYAENLKTSITGKGSISLKGDIVQHTISMTGDGQINGLDIKSKLVSLSATGKGTAALFVTDTLSLDMKGKIAIQYKGTPEVVNKSVGKNCVTRLTS